MTAPVTVLGVQARAKRLFDRDARSWAASGDASAVLAVPLHPPTERAALTVLDAVRAWVAEWRAAGRDGDIEVEWSPRNWARVGSQDVPERALVRGAAAIARVAGESAAWSVVSGRLSALRELTGSHENAETVLRSHARAITLLDSDDFHRLVDALTWLRDNPSSGRLVRELPIRGIHSKWIESRQGLVESLHRVVVGGEGLGLRVPPPLVRMRVLDPALAVGGLMDISAPVTDLAGLGIAPDRVYVFESLATVLAMPPTRGAVVVHGGGHRVDLVARLPWAQSVVYWGDLDSHGFAILHRLRARGVQAVSVLMDSRTLLDHVDLWVDDPTPNTAVFAELTSDESATLRLLSSRGNIRLEQERIPWEYALAALGGASPSS